MRRAGLRKADEADPHQPVRLDAEQWRISDGVLFGVLSSLVLWSLIIVGLHATLS